MLTIQVTVRIISPTSVCNLDCLKNLQSALKSPPSTTGAAEDTVGGSLKTAENEVWLRCFRQWISEEKTGYFDGNWDYDADQDQDNRE